MCAELCAAGPRWPEVHYKTFVESQESSLKPWNRFSPTFPLISRHTVVWETEEILLNHAIGSCWGPIKGGTASKYGQSCWYYSETMRAEAAERTENGVCGHVSGRSWCRSYYFCNASWRYICSNKGLLIFSPFIYIIDYICQTFSSNSWGKYGLERKKPNIFQLLLVLFCFAVQHDQTEMFCWNRVTMIFPQ